MLTSWTHNSEMMLSRNPYYWKPGADGKPLPYLDKIRFLIVPDDATRILKLKAGEIEGTEFVPFSRVAELKADPKIHMVLFPSAKVIYFNSTAGRHSRTAARTRCPMCAYARH